ncbi:MAG: O-antigen ligase family protein [Sulfuricurvum sp.]|nr:O-antigen ligase family protein [Sulfuricurvum sp.]
MQILKKLKENHLFTNLNYLLISYAFFIPISNKASSFILISVAILLFFSNELKSRFLIIIQDKVVQAFLLFYMLHFLWMIGSEHLDAAIFKAYHYKSIFAIIIIAMTIQKEFIMKILSSFAAGMLMSEVFSYTMALNIKIPFVHLKEGMGNVPFMQSYTQYATVLSITLGLILYNLITDKNTTIYKKMFMAIFFTSASLNIFIVASRIGYILYTLSIFSVLLFVYKKEVKKIIVPSILLMTLGYTLAYNFSDVFRSRTSALYHDLITIPDGDFSTSNGTRAGYYFYGIDIIKNNFIFGVGAGDHIAEIKKIIISEEHDQANKNNLLVNIWNYNCASLHSEYLDNTLQFGIIGLIVFLNIFYQLLFYNQVDNNRRVIQIILIVSMLFVSIGSIIFLAEGIVRVFVFLSAVSLYTYDERKQMESSSNQFTFNRLKHLRDFFHTKTL